MAKSCVGRTGCYPVPGHVREYTHISRWQGHHTRVNQMDDIVSLASMYHEVKVQMTMGDIGGPVELFVSFRDISRLIVILAKSTVTRLTRPFAQSPNLAAADNTRVCAVPIHKRHLLAYKILNNKRQTACIAVVPITPGLCP